MHVATTTPGRHRARLGLVFGPMVLLGLFLLSSVIDGAGVLSALTSVTRTSRTVGTLRADRALPEPSAGET